MRGGTFRGNEIGASSAVELDSIDLLARGFIAASPLFLLTTIGARGVESWPVAGQIGAVEVLSPRRMAAPYPIGPGWPERPALDRPVGFTFFVLGIDACLHVRGRAAGASGDHARIPQARGALMIAVEGASFRPCPVVPLPSRAAGFDATGALPRFHELLSRPST